jgi:hypothetical protein
MSMSEAEATELIEDKIKFQLFFAEKYYNKLVEYQQEETTDFLKTFVSRVRFEAELESLLAHLIGARDALLYRIRNRLGLCIKENDVHLSKINKKLLWTKNRRLLSEMCSVSHDGFWLDHVNELRNTGIHRNIIPIRKSVTINENLNNHMTRSSPMRITFTFEDSQTLEIIPYLNDSIQKMRVLIESIIAKEPLLKK